MKYFFFRSLFLTEGRIYSYWTRTVLFPLLALIPPTAVAMVTNSLEFLVGITGSYAGAGIQYVVPAALVYYARQVKNTRIFFVCSVPRICFCIALLTRLRALTIKYKLD